MTYQQKLRKVMENLDPNDPDADVWAVALLKAIGITPENPDGIKLLPSVEINDGIKETKLNINNFKEGPSIPIPINGQ